MKKDLKDGGEHNIKTAKTKKTSAQEKSKLLVLLDTHAIIHRAYHALPDFASSKGEPTGALYGLTAMLLRIIADFKPDYIVACYDLPKPTHRHEVYKDYKAGRAKTDDALVAQIIRSRDIFNALHIPMYEKEGFEADDMLGTIVERVLKNEVAFEGEVLSGSASSGDAPNLSVLIASGDMDTLQLVHGKQVQVFTLKKGINDTIVYDEDAVRARFGFGPELLPDYKGLRGDPSDNIIGIKGIGEKTGGTLINTFGTIEHMYEVLKGEAKCEINGKKLTGKEAFEEAGLTPRIIKLIEDGEEDALFSKTLATIRRDAPIDFSLPKTSWRDGIDINKASALFSELEFRKMTERLKESLTGVKTVEKNVSASGSRGDSGSGFGSAPALGSSLENESLKIDAEDLSKTLLALWVVDSNITNPTLEDLFNFANTNQYEVAKNAVFVELEKRKSTELFEKMELPFIPVVQSIMDAGIQVDPVVLDNLSKEYHKQINDLEKEIWKLAGVEFNVASPKQLGEVLFERLGLKGAKGTRQKKTPGGALSTKESELEKLKESHPIVGLVLKHRELSKLLGTYIDVIPSLLDRANRLHTTLIQAGTTTGRLSSKDPNLQNIPIKTESGRRIRNAFVASPGFSLVSIDYSQIELRIAAILSGDPKLIQIFKDGTDVHTAVASSVFGVDASAVDKEMRRRAKVINFGILYGMGVTALRQNLADGDADVSREDAQKFYNEYFANFSGLAQYLERVKAETAQRGYTETLFGRRRYFEGIKSKLPFIRAAAERMAINAPIQGTDADINKMAMIRIYEWLNDKGLKYKNDVKMILQVHDEILFEIKDEIVKEVVPQLQKIMESVVTSEQTKGVPIITGAGAGKDWGSLKPIAL